VIMRIAFGGSRIAKNCGVAYPMFWIGFLHMSKRPTLDNLQRDQARFIGPREAPRGPKMQRRIIESDAVYVDILASIVAVRAAIKNHEPIDPDRLPGKVVEIIEAHCIGRNMPIIDGRANYHAFDVLEALEVRASKVCQK